MSGISTKNLQFLKNRKKVYLVAMKEELDASCTTSEVVYTGVGKARATRGLLKWMQQHSEQMAQWEAEKAAGKRPDYPLFISVGTAGSGKHHRSDILLVEDFCNNGDSFIQETMHFNILPEATGYICASSDFFISEHNFDSEHVGRMKKAFDCMDMESFALANICAIFDFPFIGIKCISDGADDTVESFDEMLPKFRAQLNDLVSTLD